jgi:hypothetical protein
MKTNLFHTVVFTCFTALLISCNKSKEPVVIDDSDWKYIQTPLFVIGAPANWIYIDKHSVDAHDGFLTNYQDTLEFDYGAHADTFQADISLFVTSYETIDGKQAKIIKGITYPYQYGLVFDTVDVETVSLNPPIYMVRGVTLLQISKKQISTKKVLEMFRSIKFD